ncbi:MAG TPA: HAMP domain-containing methyl-accepting chemotaxis protein, partial [Bryobacteraceae bacterium]
QLDSSYLWDLMLSGSIYGAEYGNDLRGYALPIAARGTSTADEDALLLTQARQLQFAGSVVDHNATSLFRFNPSLKSSLGDALTSVADAVAKANGSADGGGKLDARTLPDSAAAASNANYQLFDRSQKILTDLVSTRIAGLNSQKTTQLMSILLGALAAIGLVYWIWRGINAQLSSIASAFARISEGDVRARADVLGKDELGRLAISLNNMADNTLSLVQGREERDKIQQNITKLLEEVSGVADGDLTQEAEVTADLTGAIADSFNYMIAQLRQIISNVQKTTTQVTSSATDVRQTATKLAEGSEVQAKQIVQASTAIAEMARSIQQVSQSATQATEVANKALESAQGGATTVRRTIDGMNAIRTQVQETAKRIKRLGESSQEIGEIVQLIGDIADRTSILALNASIQAAMAGEAGKGFGVVAEEVERLAERATEATKKISSLIKSVQGDTNEAIAAMEETTREVVGGSQLANEAGKRLDEIEAVSRQITGLVQSISELSRTQAQGSDAVSKNVAGISAYTQQTAAGAQQAEESIGRLADLAGELNSSLKRFKLPKVAA